MMKVRCWRSTDTTSTLWLAPAACEFLVPVSHDAPSHSRPVPEKFIILSPSTSRLSPHPPSVHTSESACILYGLEMLRCVPARNTIRAL